MYPQFRLLIPIYRLPVTSIFFFYLFVTLTPANKGVEISFRGTLLSFGIWCFYLFVQNVYWRPISANFTNNTKHKEIFLEAIHPF